jgi:hypothetical protein
VTPVAGADDGPTLANFSTNANDYVNGEIPKYAKFEIIFDLTDTSATNPYYPFDASPPPGIEAGTGVTVDALFRAPGETVWQSLPCFYYQPMTEASGELLPSDDPDWRCRFAPDEVGTWQYKIRATDASGTTESITRQFDCAASDRKGFVQVSQRDPRFFEFADGTPFVTPLVNVEQGNPFNTLTSIRENVQQLGENGVRFVRWFPTGEGANYFVVPFADSIRINWNFGGSGVLYDDVDQAEDKDFSFRPYYYSIQRIPLRTGERYRLHFHARVTGEQVLRAAIGNLQQVDICSATSTYHEAQGEHCEYKQDGWHEYVVEVDNIGASSALVGLRALYLSSDAPAPYNARQEGSIRTHSLRFEREESTGWSGNHLTRSDPDTHTYIDQRAAARLDEILRRSEQYGVYHKLPLFHKNDLVLGRIGPDGTVGERDIHNFYTSPPSRWLQHAYVRYFVARWSHSTALHSLELGNENHLWEESYDAAFDTAAHVRALSPRRILQSNSFWGWWAESFWTDPEHGDLMDYSDKHWYANESGAHCDSEGDDCELISNSWDDAAAYVRECWQRFREYSADFNYDKPIVRGEGGVAVSSTEPQHPAIASEPQGTYYHKKLWAHVGVLGYSCDGEWYPRLFTTAQAGQFPNAQSSTFDIFAAYDQFIRGEPLNNGRYEAIGTDLMGDAGIVLDNVSGDLRTWGVRDPVAGRALLWIDNAAHTWSSVNNGVSIPPAAATLRLPGFTAGNAYTVEWWDTSTGQPTSTQSLTADGNGTLSLDVDALATDVAVKIKADQAVNLPNHVYLPLVLNTP